MLKPSFYKNHFSSMIDGLFLLSMYPYGSNSDLSSVSLMSLYESGDFFMNMSSGDYTIFFEDSSLIMEVPLEGMAFIEFCSFMDQTIGISYGCRQSFLAQLYLSSSSSYYMNLNS